VLFAAFALFAEAVYGWSEVLASSFGGQSQAQQDKQAARQPSQRAERPPARDRGA
jgi:hypothetical protein